MNSKPTLILLTLLVSLINACASHTSADLQTSTGASFTPPEQALSEASKLYAERADLNKVRSAIEALEGARDANNRNFEIEASLAKYSYFLGSRKEVENDEAEKVLKNGLAAAMIASRMEPEKPDGHFWAAAIIGEQSKRAPMTVGIISVDKIRSGMEKVIELDPDFQGSSALLGLGQLELNTRGLAGGDLEKAIEYLEKGHEQSKSNAYFYAYLAEAYLAADRAVEAKQMVARLKNLEPDPEYKPEHEDALSIAEKLMKDRS
ncbi:MAG: hypothetical protein DWQ47_17160 [Acidobacteria bacterium]|nr:MAG: hypothetical protein DWQ32_04560 [Acidobacteriota bacterium]REK02230.1 MAG: hypothetical protein DWQ38_07590 [Acidobacteriota bacterium]REK13967.1 MAG: hypothetical protein DWQ43_10250 [Acidobacteriota bacterium]REK41962.1 MAG: hypothetical protein DWQ47_17160 [Acidobacteriota bacterium]